MQYEEEIKEAASEQLHLQEEEEEQPDELEEEQAQGEFEDASEPSVVS